MPTLEDLAGELAGGPAAPEQQPEQREAQEVELAPLVEKPSLDGLAAELASDDEEQRQLADSFSAWKASNTTATPEESVEVLRLSAATGMRADFVAENIDLMRRSVGEEQLRMAIARSPRLAEKLADAAKAPLIKDDAANLNALEWALTGRWELRQRAKFQVGPLSIGISTPEQTVAPAWARALRDSALEQKVVYYQNRQAIGISTPEEDAELERLEREHAPRDYGAENLFSRAVIGAARGAPYLAGNVVFRAVGGVGGAAVTGAAGGAAGAPVGGVGAAPGAVAGGVTGAAVGQFAGGAAFDFYENFGPLFRQLKGLTDDQGKQLLSDDEARAYAATGSLVSAGLTAGLIGPALKSIPGGKELLSKIGGDAIEKALAEATTRNAAKALVKRYTGATLSGATAIAAQAAVNATAAQIALGEHGQEQDWGSVATAAKDGFTEGLEAVLLLSAWGPGRDFIRDVGVSHAVEADAVRLQQMADAAKTSKLRERSPEEFEKHVAEGAQPGSDTVFVTLAQFDSYWSGKGLDPAEVAARVMDDGGKAYAEAKQTGSEDLAIPIEKWLSRVAPTEHALGLAEDIRLAQNGRTRRQERDRRSAIARRAEEMKKQAPEQMPEPTRQVYDDYEKKAREGGEVDPQEAADNARLVAATFERLANEIGTEQQKRGEQPVTAFELYSRYELAIRRGRPEQAGDTAAAAQKLKQGGTDGERPGSTLALERYWGDLSKGFEASPEQSPKVQQRLFTDPNTGIYNERGWDARAPNPERPLVVEFDLEGKKPLNDSLGHLSFDGALRAMALQLPAEAVSAKRGGAIYADVRDAAEAEALAKKMEAQLPGFRVTVAVGERRATLAETAKAIGDAHMAQKDAERDAGRLGHRKGIPVAYTRPEDPKINWGYDKKDPSTHDPKLGIRPDSPEAQAVLARFVAEAGPVAEQAKKAGRVEGTVVTPEQIKSLEGMSPRELAEAIFVEESTGLLNLAGDEALEAALGPAEGYVSLDLRALKKHNLVFGEEGADKVMAVFGQLAGRVGGPHVGAAHLHGDEYKARAMPSVPLEKVERWADTLAQMCADVILYQKREDGSLAVAEGLEFAWGSGKEFADADVDLNSRKSAAEAAGHVVREPFVLTGEAAAKRLAELEADPKARDLGRVRVERGDVGQALRGIPGATRRERLGRPREVTPDGVEVSLQSKGKRGDRGEIVFGLPNGGKRSFEIRLLDGADRTTLAHETFHFMAEVLGDLATAADAPESIRKDYETLTRWMGYASHDERRASAVERAALSKKADRTEAEEKRLKHLTAKEERATYGWEQFLSEGKTPSAELAGVFVRFSKWMRRIYGAVAGEGIEGRFRDAFGEELALTDEVRDVFRRLVASEDEVAKARAALDLQPFRPEALLAKMTPEERKAYEDEQQRLSGEAQTAAEQEVLRRISEATLKENREWAESEKLRLSDEVEAELDKNPVYRALSFLQDRRLPGHDELPETLTDDQGRPFRIDRASTVKAFGKEFVQTLPRTIFAGKTDAALKADDAALLLGFESGEAMLRAIQAAEPRDVVAGRETKSRLEALYGPSLVDSPDRLAAVAMRGVHDEKAAAGIVHALRALSKQLGKPRRGTIMDDDAALAVASQVIEAKSVGEIRPDRYAAAERAAAKRAMEAALAGNIEAALEAKEQQLLNNALFRLSRETRDKLDDGQDYLLNSRKDSWRQVLGLGAPEILDAHDAILSALGLSQEHSTPEARQQAMDAFEQFSAADAQELGFDLGSVKGVLVSGLTWRELGVGQALDVIEAAQSLRHMAVRRGEVQVGEQKKKLGELVREMEEHVAGVLREQKPRAFDPVKHTDEARGLRARLAAADATLLAPSTFVDILGGEDRNSPFQRVLDDGYRGCRDKKLELSDRFLTKMVKLWEDLPQELKDKRFETVDVSKDLPIPPDVLQGGHLQQGPLSRTTLWMIALNMGSGGPLGNKHRLLGGFGWDEAQVLRTLDKHMSKAEWDWVQGVWDSLEGLWPELAAMHQQETGIRPGKVVAAPVVTRWGTYRGGYFPAKYDPRPGTSKRGFESQEKTISAIFENSYGRPFVQHGHTKKRVENVQDIVNLDWSVVPSHVGQVLHDIAFRPWVRQTARLLLDGRMQSLLVRYLGPERAQQFVPWLKSVANEQADAVPAHLRGASSILSALKSRAATAALGHSLRTALGDAANPAWAVAMGDVGPTHMAYALAKTYSHWPTARSFALQHSKELQWRGENATKHLRRMLDDVGGPNARQSKFMRAVRESAFWFQEQTDKLTSTPIWFGKYNEALAGGASHDEAVRLADIVINRRFPAEATSEQPAFMRSGAFKHLVIFYGFASKVYQADRMLAQRLINSWGDPDATAGSRAAGAAKFAGSLLAVSVVLGPVSEYAMGERPEEDERDSLGGWGEWAARRTAVAPFYAIPIFGPIATAAALRASGHKAPSPRAAPAVDLVAKQVTKLERLAEQGYDSKLEAALDALDLAAVVANVSFRGERRLVEAVAGAADGTVEPADFPLTAVSGPPR